MSRGRAITGEASVCVHDGTHQSPSLPSVPSARFPALEHPPGTSLELVRLYVGENGPRISDTGLLCDARADHRSDKVCTSEDDDARVTTLTTKKAHTARNIGQHRPAGFSTALLTALQGQRWNIASHNRREYEATKQYCNTVLDHVVVFIILFSGLYVLYVFKWGGKK